MSLRLRIIDALYNAMNDGHEQFIMDSTPRVIADDMMGHDIYSMADYERVVEILQDLRAKGEI